MSEQPAPNGYDECGESLAGPVLEGFRSESWALEIAVLLGYGRTDLEAWLRHYRRVNRESLRWQQTKRANRRRRIDQLRDRARSLDPPA